MLTFSDSFDSLKLSNEQRFFDNINEKNEKFNSNNVNYFDSFYKSKSVDTVFAIEYINKNIFFRDIHVFIDRVKNVTKIKNDILLQQNFQICLKNTIFV